MKRSITILFVLISFMKMSSQDFIKIGSGFEPRTFFHQQNINYYLNCVDDNGFIYSIHYDTVTSSFNFGQEYTQIRLRIFNGISWLNSDPIKLYSKHTVDAPRVLDIKHWKGKIYVCGSFDSSQNNSGAGIIIYDGDWKSTGMKLIQRNPDYFEVNAIHTYKDGLFITGNFDSIPGYLINGMIRYDNSDWKPVGNSGVFGFQGLSGTSNVFFYGKDSIYAFNKNKIKPDSIEIGGANIKKLGVFRSGSFEALTYTHPYIAALAQYQNKLIVIPSSSLVYINKISLQNGTQWNDYFLPGNDSFYATNYAGTLEFNNLLYLLFQSPNEGMVTYVFNGSKIKRVSSFRIAETYINIEFSTGGSDIYLSGNFKSITQGSFQDSFRNIVKINYKPKTLIHGICYNDINGDKIKQSNEPVISKVNIVDNNKRMMAISDGSGQFVLRYPTGSTISLNASNGIGLTSSSSYNISSSADSIYEISIPMSSNPKNDMAVYMYCSTGKKAKQGFITRYIVEVTNNSNTNSAIQLKLNHDKRITQKNFRGFTPDLIQSGSWIKNLTISANTNKNFQFECVYSVDSFNIGEYIFPVAEINSQDNDMRNNSDTMTQMIVSAFDPNIKVTNSNSVYSENEMIKYVIYYENLGNDNAINVTVVDTIDVYLELSSIVIGGLSYSDKLKFRVENNCLVWSLEGINLPSRKQDSSNCSGFVTLRSLLSSNVKVGDTAYNKAAIFFDYQKPVITNTAKVVLKKDGAIHDIKSASKLTIYPNPGRGVFEYINETGIVEWYIYDSNGKMITKVNMNENGIIDMGSELCAGVYFIISPEGINGGQLIIIQ